MTRAKADIDIRIPRRYCPRNDDHSESDVASDQDEADVVLAQVQVKFDMDKTIGDRFRVTMTYRG